MKAQAPAWFALFAATISAVPLIAQNDSRTLVAVDVPSIQTAPDGTETLHTEKYLPVPVPACASRDLLFFSKELEISPEQHQELDAKLQKVALDYLIELQTISDSTAAESEQLGHLKEIRDRFCNKTNAVVDAVLLPHQRELLKKLKFRYAVQPRNGLSNASELKESLGMDQEQMDRFRSLLKDNEARLWAEGMDWMQMRRFDLLREVLNKEQLQKLDESLKDP